MDSDVNDFTGNHANELYRRNPGVPRKTHYGHGCHVHSKYDGEKYSSHSHFAGALSHLFPLPLLFPFFLLLPIFPSSPFFPCFQSLTHSTPQPLTNKSNESPSLVHLSSESYLTRKLLRPMAQPYSWSGEIHRLSPWCGFQHVPWREGCGCGTGDRRRGDGDGRR